MLIGLKYLVWVEKTTIRVKNGYIKSKVKLIPELVAFLQKRAYFKPDIEPNIKPDRADLGIRFYDILIQDVSITKTPWTGKHRKIRPCILEISALYCCHPKYRVV